MSPQKGRRGNCAKYIQLIQSVWAVSHVCTQYWNIVYWRGFLPIPDEISCMYLVQYPRLPFCVLIYLNLSNGPLIGNFVLSDMNIRQNIWLVCSALIIGISILEQNFYRYPAIKLNKSCLVFITYVPYNTRNV